jgi:hypothetical protein
MSRGVSAWHTAGKHPLETVRVSKLSTSTKSSRIEEETSYFFERGMAEGSIPVMESRVTLLGDNARSERSRAWNNENSLGSYAMGRALMPLATKETKRKEISNRDPPPYRSLTE